MKTKFVFSSVLLILVSINLQAARCPTLSIADLHQLADEKEVVSEVNNSIRLATIPPEQNVGEKLKLILPKLEESFTKFAPKDEYTETVDDIDNICQYEINFMGVKRVAITAAFIDCPKITKSLLNDLVTGAGLAQWKFEAGTLDKVSAEKLDENFVSFYENGEEPRVKACLYTAYNQRVDDVRAGSAQSRAADKVNFSLVYQP